MSRRYPKYSPLDLLELEPWEHTLLMATAVAGAKEDKRLNDKAVAEAKARGARG